jgi:hypothetical protein
MSLSRGSRSRSPPPRYGGDGDFWKENFERLVKVLSSIVGAEKKSGAVSTLQYLQPDGVVTIRANFMFFNTRLAEDDERPQFCSAWKKCMEQAAGVALHLCAAECFEAQAAWLKLRALVAGPATAALLSLQNKVQELALKIEVMEEMVAMVKNTSCFNPESACDCADWRAHNPGPGQERYAVGDIFMQQRQLGACMWSKAWQAMVAAKKELNMLKQLHGGVVPAEELAVILCLKGGFAL